MLAPVASGTIRRCRRRTGRNGHGSQHTKEKRSTRPSGMPSNCYCSEAFQDHNRPCRWSRLTNRRPGPATNAISKNYSTKNVIRPLFFLPCQSAISSNMTKQGGILRSMYESIYRPCVPIWRPKASFENSDTKN